MITIFSLQCPIPRRPAKYWHDETFTDNFTFDAWGVRGIDRVVTPPPHYRFHFKYIVPSTNTCITNLSMRMFSSLDEVLMSLTT